MIEKLEKLLEPFANKLAQQRHLQAISSGMMMPLGLIVIGSLFLIVANPPINLDLVDLHTGNIFLKVLISWKQFAVANYDVLTLPYNYTMGLVGLISAFGIAYCLAESYQMKSAVYGIIAMCTFLMVSAPLKDGGIQTSYLGADGVLIGRPFVTASFGGGSEGVELYVNKIISELEATMRLTGCATIADIDERVIFNG